MPSDSFENRTAAARSTASNPPPKLDEPLPCPRCDSRSTKFCYYNNYNLCQPRYFCKSCRRYWTHGGSLRNVPVGGGSRKSAKRPRPQLLATSPDPPLATPNGSSSSSMETAAVVPEPVSAVPVQEEMKPETDMEHEGLGQYHGYLTLGGYGLDPFWMCSAGGGGFLGGGAAVGGAPSFSSWQAAGDVDGGGGFIDGESFAWPGLAISSNYGKPMK